MQGKLHSRFGFELSVLLWLALLLVTATLSFRLFETPWLSLKARVSAPR